jgi:glutamate synthase domain-containing protein 1/glutamate synthase domain-containing protein 3
MMTDFTVDKAGLLLAARRRMLDNLKDHLPSADRASDAAEGGCGVLGLASSTPIAGRHVHAATAQMHNRGNGKGGGVAIAGLDPRQMGVDAETLRTHTLLQVALLDPEARGEVEARFIEPYFDVAAGYAIDHVENFRAIEGLDVRPPDVMRYFVRAKQDALARFADENDLRALPAREVEDEFVYQNSFQLNTALYASLGEKRAFVLSHGRDLIVLKIVGYAEQVIDYYQLGDQTARVWIGHQRYPTKGRVWHPGGAHPFIGLNEALVHNGDFANYHAVGEYLRQRNMSPLFLTDTEVAALLFDLWDRVYAYPLEVTLEAMAPTTDHDFDQLPAEKKRLYKAVQSTHMHGSPDGPWFFILARSRPDEGRHDLLGITDTSMLRPQVFAMYENATPESGDPVHVGLIASERQAINACLRSLADEDARFQPQADRYWAARGGSHTDGGAFLFSVTDDGGLICTNKFGEPVTVTPNRQHVRPADLQDRALDAANRRWEAQAMRAFDDGGAPTFHDWTQSILPGTDWAEIADGLRTLREFAAHGDAEWAYVRETLTLMRDRPACAGDKKRASLRTLIDGALDALFDDVPALGAETESGVRRVRRVTREMLDTLRAPDGAEKTLVIDGRGFDAEGDGSAARAIVEAASLGWTHIIADRWRGGRFAGCGLGPNSDGVRLDLYGDVGDYAASGLDGAEVYVHGSGQDQLGQIMRRGKLVIHGDVGQTFLYGAKGGEIYVQGSAAGRPLINAVGRPRAVINGTCLDYLAESFMAGDPLDGGGFVVLNGVAFDEDGNLAELPSPYPGGNLFSLASGGAIYLRDPHRRVMEQQLNGGAFGDLSDEDWGLIKPYLEKNERLFGIRIDDLLMVDGVRREPGEVYRKVAVKEASKILVETENR